MGERFVLPIGDSLVSVGIIHVDLADENNVSTFILEQNASILAGDVSIDLNQTDDVITVQYNIATIQDLLDELNDPANALLFDPNSTIDGNASLLSGSTLTPLTDLNVTSSNGISVVEILAGSGGRGYKNLDPNNIPKLNLGFNASGQERNASVSVRLGGQIEEITPCTTCEAFKDTVEPIEPSGYFLTDFHEHVGPYIEIWDKGRNERDINDTGTRALAVPKMRNGRIEKVIVVESGNGYIEPMARVRGIPTRHGYYSDGTTREDHYESRIWMCTNIRETKGGEFVKCGHIERGMYPPENCPGEVSDRFPVGMTASTQAINDWQNEHDREADAGTPVHSCNDGEVSFLLMDFMTQVDLNYSLDTHTHYNVGFKVRVCDGKKANFVLLNDPYRHPYENWEIWDANLSVITQQGKIKEIIVDYGGEMYLGGEVAVSGSGGGVDAIPVIRHDGFNTMIIFDDPNLKNLELDRINNPLGAGMGFQERPWSWDSSFPAVFGPTERPIVRTGSYDDLGLGQYSSLQQQGPGFDWSYGNPNMGTFTYGDRVEEVLIHDYGLFDSNRPETDFEITLEYNSTSSPTYKSAIFDAQSTFRLTKIFLDENATYLDMNPQNNSNLWRWRSLYSEQPSLNILDPHGNEITMVEQEVSDFIRANGNGNYLYSEEGAYFDLHIDDRLPENFYYGFGRGFAHLPAMGGAIKISEAIPGLTWGLNENQTAERKLSVYTDQNGFYTMPNLEPGMYNVAVFMEDENFQESTFRPSSNPDRVSQFIYVPGFEPLKLESDNYGYGKSKLVWSKESRSMSRANGMRSGQFQELFERENFGWYWCRISFGRNS